MQPDIVSGDLIIAQPATSYAVGDTIAYPSATVGGVTVLHRIVAETPEGFVTQGDNNTWTDPDFPTTTEIYGKQWVHIHQGGIWLNRLAQPAVIGGIVFFIILWSALAVRPVRRPRRRRRQSMGVVPHKPRAKSGAEPIN